MSLSVAMNGQMPMSEAVKFTGWSEPSLSRLVAKKKIKAQKIEGRWFFNSDDLAKAKTSNMIRGRKKRTRKEMDAVRAMADTIATLSTEPETTKLVIEIQKDQFERIRMALAYAGMSPSHFMKDKLAELDERIKAQLVGLVVKTQQGPTSNLVSDISE